MRALGIVFILLSGTVQAEPLAAVRLCFEGLPPATPLFIDHAAPHYRAAGGGAFVLDVDLTFDGAAPVRVGKAGGACLRAWLPPRTVTRIAAGFERTATNVEPVRQKVRLPLVADRWSEGGTLALKLGPFAGVGTELPGKLAVLRMERESNVAMAHPDHLPAGTYRVWYTAPPAPQVACPVELTVEAGGTIQVATHPAEVEERIAHYRDAVLPVVLARLHETCDVTQSLAVHLQLWDGVYLHPENPQRTKVASTLHQQRYALEVDGRPHPYVPGDPVALGLGQHARLVLAPESQAVAVSAP